MREEFLNATNESFLEISWPDTVRTESTKSDINHFVPRMRQYRVSHIIGPTLFFCNFSGSGAPTEELFTIFQQPWKFATL